MTTERKPLSERPAAPTAPVDAREWIALPGLFEQSELVDDGSIELRAHALVVARGKVFYGVYVRVAENDDSAPDGDARAA